MKQLILPERNFHPVSSDISFFAYTPIKQGALVCYLGYPIGANLDDPNAEVGLPTGALADSRPAGIIVQHVIDYDDTRFTFDTSDFSVCKVGKKIGVYTLGWYVTCNIDEGADEQLAGKPAYYTLNGDWTTVAGSPRAGTFESERDADGFARVYVNVPK